MRLPAVHHPLFPARATLPAAGRLACVLLSLVLAFAAPAVAVAAEPAADPDAAASTAPAWRSSPPRPSATGPLLLELVVAAGPGGCPPALADVSRQSRTVTVRLAVRGDCAAGEPSTLRTQSAGVRWGAAGVHRLRIEDDGGPGGSARLREFALVAVGHGRSDTWPEAGFWWNETGGEFDSGGPGIGLQLERQGDTLSVSVLGYGEDGSPQWLIGAGPIAEGIARVPLLRLGDGAGPFGGWRPPGEAAQAGVLHLEFLSDARAVAWFQRPLADGSLQLTPMSLVRFRFDQDHGNAMEGEWLLLARGESEPVALSLTSAEAGEGRMRLHGASDKGGGSDERWLDCTLDADRPNSPPPRCVLRDGQDRLLVDFTDIALDRMRGWRPDGTAVTAMRRRD